MIRSRRRKRFARESRDRLMKIFCFHNHPGGRAKASKEDIDLTARLEACGVMLGIPLLDHIIISSQGEVYSIKEQDEEKLNETMNRMFDIKNE